MANHNSMSKILSSSDISNSLSKGESGSVYLLRIPSRDVRDLRSGFPGRFWLSASGFGEGILMGSERVAPAIGDSARKGILVRLVARVDSEGELIRRGIFLRNF